MQDYAEKPYYFNSTSLPARFKSKIVLEPNGCWYYTAHKIGGYGRYSVARLTVPAHRYSYEFFLGPVPAGMQLDHLCHTLDDSCRAGDRCRHRACVNPAHLEPVTCKENVYRSRGLAAINAAKDSCVRGHAFTVANTYIMKDGGRSCRLCNREVMRIRRADIPRRLVRSDNKSGVPGVAWRERDGIWRANITIKGKQITLGSFQSRDEAVSARRAGELRYQHA
jgi:hypothetical protein